MAAYATNIIQMGMLIFYKHLHPRSCPFITFVVSDINGTALEKSSPLLSSDDFRALNNGCCTNIDYRHIQESSANVPNCGV